jgi:aryl-alcohol dehydrogenase-like predicted oxidoreductase
MIDTLANFGNARGLTPAQVTLAWLLAQKPFVVPIPGTTKPAHLQENRWAVDYEFEADDLKKLTEDVSKKKLLVIDTRVLRLNRRRSKQIGCQ